MKRVPWARVSSGTETVMNWGRNQLAVVNSSVTPLSEPFSSMFLPPARASCSLSAVGAAVTRTSSVGAWDRTTEYRELIIPVGAIAFSNTTRGEVWVITTPGESLSATFADTHCADRLV